MGASDGKRVTSVSFESRAMRALAKQRAAELGMKFSNYVERLIVNDVERGGPLEVRPLSDRLKRVLDETEDASSTADHVVGRIAALNDDAKPERAAPDQTPKPPPSPVTYRRPGRAGGSRGDNAGSGGRKKQS